MNYIYIRLPDVRVFGCKSRNFQSEHARVFQPDKVSQDGK